MGVDDVDEERKEDVQARCNQGMNKVINVS